MHDHNPDTSHHPDERWDLWLEPLNGPGQLLTTKPLSYDDAREAGRRMNEVRASIGYGFKVVMHRSNR